MARSLDDFLVGRMDARVSPDRGRQRLDRNAARALAAAVSSLLIASLVISQSATAFDPEGTVTGNNLAGGTVTLSDDDEGRSLVNLTDMAPGRAVTECIEITYDGTVLPVDLSFAAVVDGELARYVQVEMDSGTGGSFGNCDDFEAEQRIFSGSLSQLASRDSWVLGSLRNQGESASFRFRFDLADDAGAIGQSSAVDFVWEATP